MDAHGPMFSLSVDRDGSITSNDLTAFTNTLCWVILDLARQFVYVYYILISLEAKKIRFSIN